MIRKLKTMGRPITRNITICIVLLIFLLPCGRALGGFGDGIRIPVPLYGDLIFHPFIGVEFGYDSNVYYDDSGKEKDDVFMITRAGIALDPVTLGVFSFGADAYYFMEEYNKASDLDKSGKDGDFGFDFNFSINENFEKVMPSFWDLEFKFLIGYSETDDVEFETGEIESRRQLRYGGSVAREWGFGITEVGVVHEDNNFGPRSSSAKYGYDTTTYTGNLFPKLTEKTSGILTVQYAEQHGDSLNGTANYTSGSIGLQSRRTEKTTLALSIGYLDHSEDIETITYNANVNWLATEKISVGLTGNNTVAPSISSSNNFSTSYNAALNVNYKISDNTSGILTGGFNREEMKRATQNPYNTQETGTRKSNTWTTNFRLSYTPDSNIYNLYGQAGYQTRDSNFSGDNYDEVLLFTGIQIRY